MDKKIFLLGGNGFLGRGLRDEFSSRGVPCIWVDNACAKDSINYLDLSNNNSVSNVVDSMVDVTHIVLLAARIGRVIFNSEPHINANYNSEIFNNFTEALNTASWLYERKFDVTFYSSSEVYGSSDKQDDLLSEDSHTHLISSDRREYSSQKLEAEKFLWNWYENQKNINSLKIIRPFNVSGKYQRRGVVFEMIKDAVQHGKIWYSDDTIRTLTSSKFAQIRSADIILSEESKVFNLSENITLTMESLARKIKDRIGGDIKLEQRPIDDQIHYRQTSNISDGYDEEKLNEIIDNVHDYVKENYVSQQ